MLPSGVMLALAIFLPLVQVCDHPAYPIQYPVFWGPYVLGALVIAMALCETTRGLRALVVAAQVVVALQWGGWGVVAIGGGDASGPAWGVLLIGAVVAFWYATRRADAEKGGANATIAIGAVCVPWFALFVADPEGMWGAPVSLGAAIVMIIGGLEWRRELRRARAEAMPAARVV